MPHPRFPSGEISRRGKELYENKIRPLVEIEGNIGKLISIDVETGDYAIGDDPIANGDALFAKHPGAALYGARIGCDAVYEMGGSSVEFDRQPTWILIEPFCD